VGEAGALPHALSGRLPSAPLSPRGLRGLLGLLGLCASALLPLRSSGLDVNVASNGWKAERGGRPGGGGGGGSAFAFAFACIPLRAACCL
jgi:hypothetical protein